MAVTGPAPTTGNIAGNGQAVTISAAQFDRIGIQVLGTWVATLNFEASLDGVNFNTVGVVASGGTASTTWVTSTAANNAFIFDATPWTTFRVRCTAYTSGTANITLVSAVVGLT
jgi:hypothetical protein